VGFLGGCTRTRVSEPCVSVVHINADECLVLNDSKGRPSGRDRSRSPFSSRRRHDGDRVSEFFIAQNGR